MLERPTPQWKPVILSMEDNLVQLRLREHILEENGYLVLSALTAGEALYMLRTAHVDLIVSDHMLSGTTGALLAAELKKINPQVPVVLYSGTTPSTMGNVDCFIEKSGRVTEFLSMIRDLANRHRE
jgi:CheY-like chemotaxis protein